jgi:tRNA-Thr(GGU) m(6)t(6)A37 methyltransferase TsaA
MDGIQMAQFIIYPVGVVKKKAEDTLIEIYQEYRDALLGLEGFSHIYVLFWFHENDSPHKRRTLQVHPRGDEDNPLMGVFGTHSPRRPNLIGLTRCRILMISGGTIKIDDIDAFDGTPVIDIKCYIPGAHPVPDVNVPAWV